MEVVATIIIIYTIIVLGFILITYKIIDKILDGQISQGKAIEALLKYHIEEIQFQLEQTKEEKD